MKDMVELNRMQARSVNSSNANNEWNVNNSGNVNNNNANNTNRLAPITSKEDGYSADRRKASQTVDARSLHSCRKANNSRAMGVGEPSLPINALPIGEEVIGHEALYESMMKCKRTVLWKDSTAHFYLNDISELHKLYRELHDGTYRPRKGHIFMITRPKQREALAISFRDRVFQRSLNDNLIYPELAKHLIYDNCACQKGKGTDFCRDRLKAHLQKFYRKHGLNGYILQCDIAGYYPNMRHEVADNLFKKYLPSAQAEVVSKILQDQYSGDIGYFPGSQLLQLVGIAALNGIDHFIKEKLCVKHYIRYMDDFLLIHASRAYLAICKEKITKELAQIGFSLHPLKTKLFSVAKQFKYMGFLFRLTATGKVLMFVDPKLVKATRKEVRKMRKVAPERVKERLRIWQDYASRGSSRRVLMV